MTDALLETISLALGLPTWEARNIARSSPNRYKEFRIKKKNGDDRHVAQPARETKRLQSWLIEHYLSKLPVHNCCMAYVAQRGIKKNAEHHAKNQFLLKMDFRNFFPSITPIDFFKHTQEYSQIFTTEQDVALAALILFWKPKGDEKLRLCIGAPSSPSISNTILYKFDCTVSDYCDTIGVKYTRYADDLTFSTNTPEILVTVEEEVKNITSQLEYPTLNVNTQKTIHVSKKFSRRITGLVITNEDTVSLGRDRKRLIRAKIRHFQKGILLPNEIQKLRGTLAFANDVEPEFLTRMRLHYGDELIDHIMKLPFARNAHP